MSKSFRSPRNTVPYHVALSLVALVAGCTLYAKLNWLIAGLFGDSGVWAAEAYRFSLGELPYRDFMWTAPPLGIALLGESMKRFGATWMTAQLTLTAISAVFIFLLWKLARRLVPVPLATASVIFYLASSVITPLVSLFSLRIYTPAILTGMVGFALYLYGMTSAVLRRSSESCGSLMIYVGAAASLLSKPEFGAAVIVCQICWSLSLWTSKNATASRGLWLTRHAIKFFLCAAPAGLVYLVTAYATGPQALWQGISGYGQTTPCPWWPTGEGLVSAIGSLALGIALLSVLRKSEFSRFSRLGTAISGVIGVAVWIICLRWTGWSTYFPSDAQRSLMQQVRPALRFLAWHYLHAVLWLTFALFAGLVAELATGVFKNQKVRPRFRLTLLLTGAVSALSARAIFSHTVSVHPVLADAAVPFLCILGPFLLSSRSLYIPFSRPGVGLPQINARLPLGIAYSIFILIFFAGEIKSTRDFPREWVYTRAGWIGLREAGQADGYRLIEKKTHPGDWVIELPYGGGLTLAAHLHPAVFSAGYRIVNPDSDILNGDVTKASNRKPRVVIWESDGGIELGGSLPGCPIPHLVWNPSLGKPSTTAPLYDWVRSNYRSTGEIAGHTLYEPVKANEP